MAPNEKVEAYGLLPEAALEALGLKRGEFRSGLARHIALAASVIGLR